MKEIIITLAVLLGLFKEQPKSIQPELNGIDISHWNNVNIKDFENISFIYAKVSQGATGKDPKFNDFKKEAQKYNIPIGGYHFLTTVSVKEQFNNFYKTAGKCDLIPMLDVEGKNINSIPLPQLQNMIDEWILLCQKHYKNKPIIYCNEILYNKLDLKGCLWWADSKPIRYKSKIYLKEPKEDYYIWQYGVRRTPKGMIDCNYINKKYSINLLCS